MYYCTYRGTRVLVVANAFILSVIRIIFSLLLSCCQPGLSRTLLNLQGVRNRKSHGRRYIRYKHVQRLFFGSPTPPFVMFPLQSFTTILAFLSFSALASPLLPRDVVAPPILLPNSNSVWPIGTQQLVKWCFAL